ncbi:MAG: hypothetical protein GC191_18045 [Azospirillum sp.]|nr:hypothetical protein [Azospirillum sp.]
MELSLVVAPVVALLTVLGMFTVTDRQSTYVAEIKVPQALEYRGHSSSVVIVRMFDRMSSIRRDGFSRHTGETLASDYAQTPALALARAFQVIEPVRAIQKTVGLIDNYVEGNIILQENQLNFMLQSWPWDGEPFQLEENGDIDAVDKLIEVMAERLMARVDPYSMAIYLYRRNIDSWNFSELNEIIEREIENQEPDERVWFRNLRALVLVNTGHDQAAIEEWETAISEVPEFSLAYFNLGYLYARRARCTEAVRYLAQGTQQPADPESLSDAYSQWGLCLAALGSATEGLSKIERALEADPNSFEAYRAQGAILRTKGQVDTANVLFNKARALARSVGRGGVHHDTEALNSLFERWDGGLEGLIAQR